MPLLPAKSSSLASGALSDRLCVSEESNLLRWTSQSRQNILFEVPVSYQADQTMYRYAIHGRSPSICL
eukprot:6360910-Amphidinium_carterae.1